MAFFMIMVVLIGSEKVLRDLATEGRRDREAEAIWRGNQYVRAIRIFYRKTGHYPQALDDLQKGIPGMHFIRSVAMKDPMNTTDGTWRLIYINAAGQLIGSTRYASLQQMALIDLNGGKLPTPPSSDTESGSNSDTQDSGAASNQNSTTGNNGQNNPDQSQQAGQTGQTQTNAPGTTSLTSSGTSPFGTPSPGSLAATTTTTATAQGAGGLTNLNPQNLAAIAQQKPTGPVDGPVFGGFITGVGSGHNFDGSAVKYYNGGKTYQQWEFIWNPMEDQARAMQNGLAPQQGQAPGTQPGQSAGQGGFSGLPVANPNGGAPTPPEIPAPQPGPGQPQPQEPDQQQ